MRNIFPESDAAKKMYAGMRKRNEWKTPHKTIYNNKHFTLASPNSTSYAKGSPPENRIFMNPIYLCDPEKGGGGI